MTLQMQDVVEETSVIPTKDTKAEVIFRVPSSCSCPQCNSFDCFDIRYEKGNYLPCTCLDCKDMNRKNDSSNKSGEGSYSKVVKKLQDDGQLYSLHTDTKSNVSSEKSNEACRRELMKKVVKDDLNDSLNTNTKCDLPYNNSESKMHLELTRRAVKEHAEKDALNAKIRHDLENKLINNQVTKFNEDQREALNIHSKSELINIKYNDQSYHKITREVVEEDKHNNSKNTNTKLDSVNEISNCDSHHDKTRKVFKDEEHKDPIRTCTKCGHLNNRNDAKQCCYKNKKNYKSNGQKDEKLNSKSCYENPKRGNKENEQKDISYREITRKTTKEHEQKDRRNKHVKSEKSEVDLCEHTEFSYKDKTFIEDKVHKSKKSYEESYTRNYSVAMTYSRKEERTESEDRTATLSAQIMDLPYEDYKDSLSSYKPTNSVNTSKITKPDILAKLKEIYKACSCKICECIPGYSTKDVFKRSTCGCEDTKHMYSNIKQRDSYHSQHECIQVPHSGCACYRCDRKDCRGVWKNKTAKAVCDCEPCECVKFSKSFTKPCDCEPCQCTECTALNFHLTRPVIVAPVQRHFQQNMCQCEPCECAHCTHNYGGMASNLMREASTGMVTHRSCNCDICENNSCQFDGLECGCTQSRIIRKPIDRSVRDYDLRRALVKENSFSRKRSVKIRNCDTIAMFAFSNNNYSNTAFNKFKDNCRCKDCECIICKNNEKEEWKVKNSCKNIPRARTDVSDNSYSTCKCQTCECQICCKDEAGSDMMQATRAVNNYDCKTCTRLPYSSQNIDIYDYSEQSFKNKDSLIDFFRKCSNEVTTDFASPLKKGKLLTPSMFEAKILSQRKFQSQSGLPIVMKPLTSHSILKVNSKNSNITLCPQNVKICHLKSINKSFDACKQSSNKILLSAYLNGSYTETNQKHFDNVIETDTIRYTTSDQQCNNNETPTTSIIFHKRPSDICVGATINEVINHNQSSMEENDKITLLNSIKTSNVHRKSKAKRNSDLDLFFSRILSFEKSLLQIQADISQSRKALAEICSKNGMPHDNFSTTTRTTETSLHDTITRKESRYETNLIDPTANIEIYTEPDNLILKSENDNMDNIDNNAKALIDSIDSKCNYLKYNHNDNFSKGDNKTYTRHKNMSHVTVKKLKRNITRSKFKKLLRNSENKIIDIISDQVKENYRYHGKNELNWKYSTKSASTSHENVLVAEPQKLKFKDDNEYSQMDISAYQSDPMSWSVLRKNLYMTHTPVTYKDISTIPELQQNTKRVVQSISLQTNETQGYAALTKLQIEVSNLLNSPLLHVKRLLKSDLNDIVERVNIDFRPKSKLDLELKHKMFSDVSSQTQKQMMLVDKEVNYDIGPSMEETNNIEIMKKLVDLLLVRTVCKSELTKPFSNVPEKLEVPKINSIKSSCEGLKARFLGLRRVSDHTVLVRWKMPRQVEDVQGYELQVDGRPVQKILSPTRCMAVLTCLPHCEKLVLTIRTLTVSELPSDHHPAATIVYCPREKRPRYSRLNFNKEQ